MKNVFIVCSLFFGFLGIPTFSAVSEKPLAGPSVDFKHGDLKVSQNHRFLQFTDGTPFFYLGDTAWELFHRLNSEEAGKYLENRRQKGFTVIQSVVLAELDGLNTPNAYNEKPFMDNNPLKPNEKYFNHVDSIVDTAEKKGLFIGMLPTWGDKTTKAWGAGPVVFTTEALNIPFDYGKFLGNRYKNKPNIIWIMIGDRDACGYESIWRAMAKGLREGDGGKHLITCHPMGGHSSSEWFQNEDWLDFNMLQSGHSHLDNQNYQMITKDYNLTPVKPTMDAELRYEDHPVNWDTKKGWFDDFDVRQGTYWSLFAGGFGVTYGCHDIWQMMAPGRKPISAARNNWYDVLDLPAAWDMMHVRNLLESHPFFTRIPDQSLLASPQPKQPGAYIAATRGDNYAFIYTPYGGSFTMNMGKISGKQIRAAWFDPRTGNTEKIGVFDNKDTKEFDPPNNPERGNDWILIVDDDSVNFLPRH